MKYLDYTALALIVVLAFILRGEPDTIWIPQCGVSPILQLGKPKVIVIGAIICILLSFLFHTSISDALKNGKLYERSLVISRESQPRMFKAGIWLYRLLSIFLFGSALFAVLPLLIPSAGPIIARLSCR